MDGGRTNRKDFVAVNVQLFSPKDNQQVIYTLACCHFDERKTGLVFGINYLLTL